MVAYYGFRIGETPLYEVPQLMGRYGARTFLKDESKNTASGTFKDRRNMWVLEQDGQTEEPVFYVQITSGNSGLSMGRLCQTYERETGKQRRSISVVHKKLPREIKNKLRAVGEVVEVDLSSGPIPSHTLEQRAKDYLQKQDAKVRVVERTGGNSDGYGEIAKEILERVQPRYIFCPVGEGELMAKLSLALSHQESPAKIVGVTVNGNINTNGKSFERPKQSRADKLVTPYSDFKELLERLSTERGHEILTVDERQIQEEEKILRELMIDAEPSAAVAFAGARRYSRERGFSMDDNVVIINTGKGECIPYNSHWPRIARAATAAILLVGLGAGGMWGWREYQDYQQQQRWREEGIQRILKNMEGNPTYNDLVAYAIFRGRGQIDTNVLGNLEMWCIYSDLITRDMYNKKIGTLRPDVDGFEEWLRKQTKTEEERLKRFMLDRTGLHED